MKSQIIVAFTCLALAGPSLQMSFAPENEGQFMEARLCASGQVIRIPLGNQEEEDPAPMQACHALCARESDDDGASGSSNG